MRTSDRRPEPNELTSPVHWELVERLQGDRAIPLLQSQMFWACELASSVSAQSIDAVHHPHLWSIRQVFAHCLDAERAFGDRMWRLAAGDTATLVPFDHDAYAQSRFGLGNVSHLIGELGALRQANTILLKRIKPNCWDHCGTIEGQTVSVRGLAWLSAAHLHHHFEVIEQRCEITVQRAHDPSQMSR